MKKKTSKRSTIRFCSSGMCHSGRVFSSWKPYQLRVNRNAQMMAQQYAMVAARHHDFVKRIVSELRKRRQRRFCKSRAGEDIGKIRNPNDEIRNKFEIRNPKQIAAFLLGISNLFRTSIFGFRISSPIVLQRCTRSPREYRPAASPCRRRCARRRRRLRRRPGPSAPRSR